MMRTGFVARSIESLSRDPVSRAQFPAGGLGVAFFATGPGLGLIRYILFIIGLYTARNEM